MRVIARPLRLFLVGVLLVVGGCRRAAEPERPSGVPAQAFWLGGADGGVFVLLQASASGRADYKARIFYPHGEVWYEGLLHLDRGPAVNVADQHLFSGWDGTALLLSDGRRLSRIRNQR